MNKKRQKGKYLICFMFVPPGNKTEMKTRISALLERSQQSLLQLKATKHDFFK